MTLTICIAETKAWSFRNRILPCDPGPFKLKERSADEVRIIKEAVAMMTRTGYNAISKVMGHLRTKSQVKI